MLGNILAIIGVFEAIFALLGTGNLSYAMAVTVFPQPDSPTSPNVSPLRVLKEISSTARTACARCSAAACGRVAS